MRIEYEWEICRSVGAPAECRRHETVRALVAETSGTPGKDDNREQTQAKSCLNRIGRSATLHAILDPFLFPSSCIEPLRPQVHVRIGPR